jgi:hypothetical protein
VFLQTRLFDKGYADAEVDTSVVVDTAARTAVVKLTLVPKYKTTVEDIIVTGNDDVSERTIRKSLTFHIGDIFQRSEMLRSQRALYESNLFRRASIEPRPPIDIATPDSAKVVVVTAAVSGIVSNAADLPEGNVWVEGCNSRTQTDADGSYYLSTTPGPCTVRAYRRDGALTVWSDPVDVDPEGGNDAIANLELPAWRTGGLGIAVTESDDGIRVGHIFEGTPAADAGLQQGDVIVSVDGDRTDKLSLEDFIHEATGEEGTDVRIVVHGVDGTQRQLTITRRYVPPPTD